MKLTTSLIAFVAMLLAVNATAQNYWEATEFPKDVKIVQCKRMSIAENTDLLLLGDDGHLYVYTTSSYQNVFQISSEEIDDLFITDFSFSGHDMFLLGNSCAMIPFYSDANLLVLTDNDKIYSFAINEFNYDATNGLKLVSEGIPDVDITTVAHYNDEDTYVWAGTDKGLYAISDDGTNMLIQNESDESGIKFLYKDELDFYNLNDKHRPTYFVTESHNLFKLDFDITASLDQGISITEIVTEFDVDHVEYINGNSIDTYQYKGLIGAEGELYYIDAENQISGPITISNDPQEITTIVYEKYMLLPVSTFYNFVGTKTGGVFMGIGNDFAYTDITEGLPTRNIMKLEKSWEKLYAITDSGLFQSTFDVLPDVHGDVKDIENISAQIYPNPAGDNITVSLPYATGPEIIVTISDLTGRLVETVKPIASFENSIQLSTSGLLPGPYVLKVQTAGRVAVGKLMKK